MSFLKADGYGRHNPAGSIPAGSIPAGGKPDNTKFLQSDPADVLQTAVLSASLVQAPLRTQGSKAALDLPDAPKSSALWRGMYTDGLRAGFWLTYDAAIAKDSHEVLKKHGCGWASEPKIWVGPLKSAEKIIEALHAGWPLAYPLDQGMAIWSKALGQPEPFWAMYAVPIVRRIQKVQADLQSVDSQSVDSQSVDLLDLGLMDEHDSPSWSLTFPYDPVASGFLKKENRARWNEPLQKWVIHHSLEAVLELLDRMGAPESQVRVIGLASPADADGSIEDDHATGAWKPYFVGVNEDDVITERVKLEVGGAEKPVFSSVSPAEAQKRKEAEAAKALREQLIQRAFHEPLALLPVDEAVIQEITARCALMPHQPDGVRHFLSKTSALNGDDMGLGKTRQTVAAASVLPGGKIIVCPASLKDNWRREINMVIPDAQPFIFESVLPDVQPEWMIVNYERLGALLDALHSDQDWKFTVAAFDEAHYLKEPGAKRTRNAFDLAARAHRKWLLTATPMLNKAEETWTLLRLSGHPAGQVDVPTFVEHFTRSKNERHGLGDRISEWMIRRMKESTLTMAGKFHHEPLVSASADQLRRYHAVMDDDETRIAIQKINIARQWLEAVKRAPILEMLGDLQADAKAIVFCNFEATVEWFMDILPEGLAVRLTGKESRKQRDLAVQKFQNDLECRWFVANIKAAGVGLNLTAATYVFFVSRPWTPADQEQAEDRAYRIGQDRRVEIYVPIVPDTIDEQIRALLLNKKKITEDVLLGAVEADKRRRDEAVHSQGVDTA